MLDKIKTGGWKWAICFFMLFVVMAAICLVGAAGVVVPAFSGTYYCMHHCDDDNCDDWSYGRSPDDDTDFVCESCEFNPTTSNCDEIDVPKGYALGMPIAFGGAFGILFIVGGLLGLMFLLFAILTCCVWMVHKAND